MSAPNEFDNDQSGAYDAATDDNVVKKDIASFLAERARNTELLVAVVALATERVAEFFALNESDQRKFVDAFEGDHEYEGKSATETKEHFSRQIAADLCCKWFLGNVVNQHLPGNQWAGKSAAQMLDLVHAKVVKTLAPRICVRVEYCGEMARTRVNEGDLRQLTGDVAAMLNAQRAYARITRLLVQGQGGTFAAAWEFAKEDVGEAVARALGRMVAKVLEGGGVVGEGGGGTPSEIEWRMLAEIVATAVHTIYAIERLESAPLAPLTQSLAGHLAHSPPSEMSLALVQATRAHAAAKFVSASVYSSYAMYVMAKQAAANPGNPASFRVFLARAFGLVDAEYKAPYAMLLSALQGAKQKEMVLRYKAALEDFIAFGEN